LEEPRSSTIRRAVVAEDAGVTPGDAGIRDDEIGGDVRAAQDELVVDGMLAAGPYTLMDEQ
jgi:hypothetical protein